MGRFSIHMELLTHSYNQLGRLVGVQFGYCLVIVPVG